MPLSDDMDTADKLTRVAAKARGTTSSAEDFAKATSLEEIEALLDKDAATVWRFFVEEFGEDVPESIRQVYNNTKAEILQSARQTFAVVDFLKKAKTVYQKGMPAKPHAYENASSPEEVRRILEADFAHARQVASEVFGKTLSLDQIQHSIADGERIIQAEIRKQFGNWMVQ